MTRRPSLTLARLTLASLTLASLILARLALAGVLLAGLAGAATPLRGFAFDGGSGIAEVAVSADGGKSWQTARLGEDLGPYSFRQWTSTVTLPAGEHALMVRARSTAGATQPMTAQWNPTGYMRNVVETVRVRAA